MLGKDRKAFNFYFTALTQVNLCIKKKYKNKTQSGLWDAIEKFRDSGDISVFEFKDKNDIVRNKLITKILEKYEE